MHGGRQLSVKVNAFLHVQLDDLHMRWNGVADVLRDVCGQVTDLVGMRLDLFGDGLHLGLPERCDLNKQFVLVLGIWLAKPYGI